MLFIPLGFFLGCTDGAPIKASSADPAPKQSSDDGITLQASGLEREMNPDASPDELVSLVEGNNQFAFDLYHEVKEPGRNIFFSPYSISLALAMTYAGARGETETAMAETLHFTLPQERLHPAFNALDLKIASLTTDGFDLKTANSLWGKIGKVFLQPFLDLLAVNYGAKIRQLDFAFDPEGSAEIINKWVEEKTEEKIKNLIPPDVLDATTALVLVNAIYFKATWLNQFEKDRTRDGDFHLIDGTMVQVPMMSQEEEFAYCEDDGFQAVYLPYKGGKVSMMIILPAENEFERIENEISPEWISSTLKTASFPKVNLKMPRFELDWGGSLKDILINLGMETAFNTADFSGMDGGREMYIEEVIHKAFVLVDEEGTEAAAATAVIMGERAALVDWVEMTIDRPFIFLIRNNETGSILFLGRVMDPRKGA